MAQSAGELCTGKALKVIRLLDRLLDNTVTATLTMAYVCPGSIMSSSTS